MKVTDTSKISFLLPVRIDGFDRLENLTLSVKYLKKYFPLAEIILVENDKTKTLEQFCRVNTITYFFILNGGRFSKSQSLNYGILNCSRDFIGIWDVDVIINPAAIYKSIRILCRGRIKVIVPHNTVFVNVKGALKKKILDSADYSIVPYFGSLINNTGNFDCEIYRIPSGVVVLHREMLRIEGGYNKKMISYGWEDIEVLRRLQKLGYYYFFLKNYNIIHLDHHRGKDSERNEYFEKNENEFNKVIRLSKKDLLKYVDRELVIDESISQKQKDAYRKSQQIVNILTFKRIQFWIAKFYIYLMVNRKQFLPGSK